MSTLIARAPASIRTRPAPRNSKFNSATVMALLLFFGVLAGFAVAQDSAAPEQLYRLVWKTTADNIFDTTSLGNWNDWEHKFDGRLHTQSDADKAINEMLASLHDPYTRYLDRKQTAEEHQERVGYVAGIGAVWERKHNQIGTTVTDADSQSMPATTADGYPYVKEVKDGPAKHAGVIPGDTLISVDEFSARGWSMDQLVDKIRGAEGSTVKLQIRHRNGAIATLTLTRQRILVPDVETRHLGNGIGYFRLSSFMEETDRDEFKAGFADLKDCRGLIVDMRGNLGGYINNAQFFASMCLDQGIICSKRERVATGGYRTTVCKLTSTKLIGADGFFSLFGDDARDENMTGSKPMILIIDNYSASATEIVAGALKDNHRATLIGDTTFGKGIGQRLLRLPNGTELHVTSMRWYTPNGTWIGGGIPGSQDPNHGIKPDLFVPAAGDFDYGDPDDNQLQSAITMLIAKLSNH